MPLLYFWEQSRFLADNPGPLAEDDLVLLDGRGLPERAIEVEAATRTAERAVAGVRIRMEPVAVKAWRVAQRQPGESLQRQVSGTVIRGGNQ